MFFVPKERSKAAIKRILDERSERKRKEMEEIEKKMEKNRNKQKL